MKLVTAQQMQEIDRRTIEGGHVPSRELMERAGAAVADIVLDAIEAIDAPQVEILCGKGNNGGDGLVVGRLLAASGVGVRVWLTHSEGLSPDAEYNLQKLRQTDCIIAEIPAGLQDPGEVCKQRWMLLRRSSTMRCWGPICVSTLFWERGFRMKSAVGPGPSSTP